MLKPKLLADENIPRTVITILRENGYDLLSIWETSPGISDDEVIRIAANEHRVIITFDKDFGRRAIVEPGVPGVILLRISPGDPRYVARRILVALSITDPYNKLIVIRKRTIKIINLS